MSELGQFIKSYRQENSISMRELAIKCDVSHGYINKLEKGIDTRTGKSIIPTVETINKLAKGMNIAVEILLELSGVNLNAISTQIIPSKNKSLSRKDERDIANDVNSIMTKIRSGKDGPLYYNGEEMDVEDLDLFEDALEFALKRIKVENKEKYTPKKFRK